MLFCTTRNLIDHEKRAKVLRSFVPEDKECFKKYNFQAKLCQLLENYVVHVPSKIDTNGAEYILRPV